MRNFQIAMSILAIAFACSSPASADVISHNFQFDIEGTLSGTTLTAVQPLNAGGVSFTATLTAEGSGNIDRGSTGLGVEGSSSILINGSEYITFSIAISGLSGGTAVFNGFDQIDLDSFDTENGSSTAETAALSADTLFDIGDQIVNGVAGGSSDIFSLTGSPTTFSVVSNGSSNNRFRVRDLRASFVTTAVPEPSGMIFVVMSFGCCFVRRSRH